MKLLIKLYICLDIGIYRIPIWPYMKLLFCMWLVLPIFNGAAYVYENVVRKYVKLGDHLSSNYPPGQKKVLQMMSLDARKYVERFIDQYGVEAFERVVKAVRTNTNYDHHRRINIY